VTTSKWEAVTQGPMEGSSIESARLFEKTEQLEVPDQGRLYRTTIFNSNGTITSVSLAWVSSLR
jgi:hypothetical protein